jgi:putative ABC transport system permease protein
VAITSGRVFTPAEEQAGKAVCLVGATVRRNLFRDDDPVGQRIRLRDLTCDVIGTLGVRGQGGFGQDQDDVVIMPFKAVQRRMTGNRDIRQILVQVSPAYDMATVTASIQALLRERRNIRGAKQDDFNIFDTAQIAATLQGTTRVMTSLLGASPP